MSSDSTQAPRVFDERHRSAVFPPPGVMCAALAGVVLCCYLLPVGSEPWRAAPFPFGWRDVAVVYTAAYLPLAGLLATWWSRHPRRGTGLPMGAALLAGCVAVIVLVTDDTSLRESATTFAKAGALRHLLALGIATGAMLAAMSLLGRAGGATNAPLRMPRGAVVFGLAACALVPAVYSQARSRHELSRVAELLEASRLGEAQAVMKQQLEWNPSARLKREPLSRMLADVEATLASLEAQVQRGLPAESSAEDCVARARQLAMLNRTDEALGVLDRRRIAHPAAENLRGTIYESRGDWEAALAAYSRARAGWKTAEAGAERDAGRQRAVQGVAYCCRKSGRYSEAEAAYLDLLALDPGADSHFLLGQFYEDTQQTGKAEQHVRKAMMMAPRRYEEPGRRLLDRLATVHFGCLGLFREQSSAAR